MTDIIKDAIVPIFALGVVSQALRPRTRTVYVSRSTRRPARRRYATRRVVYERNPFSLF